MNNPLLTKEDIEKNMYDAKDIPGWDTYPLEEEVIELNGKRFSTTFKVINEVVHIVSSKEV